jgi:AcrR family transcriptional regulator
VPARRHRTTEAVRAQIVEAAAHLFAQQAPSTVTLRQIAARADVQHSLIIRHFGSKAGLVRAVVDRTAGAYAESVLRGDDAADGFVQAMRHLLDNPVAAAAFANAQLSAERPRAVQRSYPGATLHRQLLADAAGPHSRDPRVVAAVGLTLAAGWAMLEGWARVAFDLEAMPIDEVRDEVAAMLRDLIERGADLDPAPPGAARRR